MRQFYYPNPNTSAAFWCNTSIQAAEDAAAIMAEEAEQQEEYMLAVSAAKLQRVVSHMWQARASASAHPYNPLREPIYVAAPRNPATVDTAQYAVQRSSAAFGNLSRNCRYMHGMDKHTQREAHKHLLQWIAAAWILDTLYPTTTP